MNNDCGDDDDGNTDWNDERKSATEYRDEPFILLSIENCIVRNPKVCNVFF